METNLSAMKAPNRGKVRDIYDLGKTLLFVSTDRISAYDSVLPSGIRGKGAALNRISEFWFKKTAADFPNHFISTDISDYPPMPPENLELLKSRSMLVRKTRPLPVECVVRGHISGSAWREYERSGTVCAIAMPGGLRMGEKLPEPLFTPSTKAAVGERDMNITFGEACGIAGKENMETARAASIDIYHKAAEIALSRGIIIADTKFEFGVDPDGRLIFIDEMLTPDSSRFWSAEQYASGKTPESFDKQFVRDYLDSIKWDRTPPAPELPREVGERTSEKYAMMERIFAP